MDKIKLKEEFIESSLEYEQEITNSLLSEIDEIDEYLEFIFEHKTNEIVIKRKPIMVNTSNKNYCPSEYYGVGKESGTYSPIEEDSMNDCISKGSYEEDKVFRDYNWIEWQITFENHSYRDSFEIIITPFVFNMYSYSSDNHKNSDGYDRELLNIFTAKFYEKWNDKLKDIAISKKKNKVKTMMRDSYKIMGIDRQAKIKSILKEE